MLNVNPSMKSRRFLALLGSIALCVGCASIQRQGDRAFEKGDCAQALENYAEAIGAGSKDPGIYHRSAQCSLKIGDLPGAERFYSDAMRFGAGIEVARELAGFYIKTSNYVSAVRVYQYLLYQEAEKQPLYNNLGTALMYAGKPFDAESYLMVAQQLDPVDPTPYVNLGLLYDRHLKQPWLAINFYECYDELTRGRAQNGDMVRQRAAELRDRYYRLYEEGAVDCGKAYEPSVRSVVDLADLKDIVDAAVPEDQEPLVQNDGPVGEAPVIERQVTEVTPTDVAGPPISIEEARAAFEGGRWAEAVTGFTGVPVSQLSVRDQKSLGVAYLRQANWAMAGHWLELALTTAPDSEILSALFDVYERSKDADRLAGLCNRYGSLDKYEKIVAERCASNGDN